ncbi:DUF6702 family protein [Pedobacter caeni]|uniref:Uncharacterized protein n=1 Tax=Pedobacter caeni TaxID=288992 RepID=A0A1M4YZ43_9SPHI|nr:DUF6702 family protein [Pedobacter caeni]SHF11079.1 hypothetical protein SAMN04488522_102125 [Pedobacter caeni]
MLQVLLISFLHLFHPFYVSVTEITQNSKTKAVQVSVRIFFDDFEKALDHQYKTKVNILKPVDRKKVDQLIADYVQKHLQVKANQKSLVLKYIGYEIEEDAAWCYFETAPVAAIKTFDINNNILFEEHESQSNMVHVTVNGSRKSTKLDNPKSQARMSF